MRSSREWRWGRHGSLSLVMSGAKAGQWFDHEAGQGGGFVDLIARETQRPTGAAPAPGRLSAPAWLHAAGHHACQRVPRDEQQNQCSHRPSLIHLSVRQEDRAERARRAADATMAAGKAGKQRPSLSPPEGRRRPWPAL